MRNLIVGSVSALLMITLVAPALAATEPGDLPERDPGTFETQYIQGTVYVEREVFFADDTRQIVCVDDLANAEIVLSAVGGTGVATLSVTSACGDSTGPYEANYRSTTGNWAFDELSLVDPLTEERNNAKLLRFHVTPPSPIGASYSLRFASVTEDQPSHGDQTVLRVVEELSMVTGLP